MCIYGSCVVALQRLVRCTSTLPVNIQIIETIPLRGGFGNIPWEKRPLVFPQISVELPEIGCGEREWWSNCVIRMDPGAYAHLESKSCAKIIEQVTVRSWNHTTLQWKKEPSIRTLQGLELHHHTTKKSSFSPEATHTQTRTHTHTHTLKLQLILVNCFSKTAC